MRIYVKDRKIDRNILNNFIKYRYTKKNDL